MSNAKLKRQLEKSRRTLIAAQQKNAAALTEVDAALSLIDESSEAPAAKPTRAAKAPAEKAPAAKSKKAAPAEKAPVAKSSKKAPAEKAPAAKQTRAAKAPAEKAPAAKPARAAKAPVAKKAAGPTRLG